MVGTKLGVSSILSYNRGTSLSRDLGIANFVDYVRDENDLRWEGM
jgi:hypothetical protein